MEGRHLARRYAGLAWHRPQREGRLSDPHQALRDQVSELRQMQDQVNELQQLRTEASTLRQLVGELTAKTERLVQEQPRCVSHALLVQWSSSVATASW